MQIELAAGRAMLTHNLATGPVALDPRYAIPDRAPTFGDRSLPRAVHRTAALAKALAASIRTAEAVQACTAPCPLVGVGAHLTMSTPVISGRTATITVTLLQSSADGRQRVYYETVQMMLSRSSRGWVVTKEVQLGIS